MFLLTVSIRAESNGKSEVGWRGFKDKGWCRRWGIEMAKSGMWLWYKTSEHQKQ